MSAPVVSGVWAGETKEYPVSKIAKSAKPEDKLSSTEYADDLQLGERVSLAGIASWELDISIRDFASQHG